MEYIPSKYQLAIFDFVEKDHGNAVIEAVPGAGKTYTLIQCLKHIPKNAKVLVAAFNTDIIGELKGKIAKLEDKPNIDCRTLHSLGLSILVSNYYDKIDTTPSDYKYTNYISAYLSDYKEDEYIQLSKKDKKVYAENIKTFVDFGRYYLCKTEKDLQKVQDQYSFDCIGNEKKIALEVMKWGKEHIEIIDFTDMVWLPIVLNCKPYNHLYDWILVDEAQDLEKEERVLIELCTKMQTRRLFFGEKKQTINIFKGTDNKTFTSLQEIPNTIKLPLSITYRCPKSVVRFLHRYNPQVQAAPNAIEGEVKWHCDINEIEDGSMVLCRANAPLMELYAQLSDLGKTAFIRGKDIGKNLISLIENTHEEKLNKDLKDKGVFSSLYDQLISTIDEVMRKNRISEEMAIEDLNVAQFYDKIMALEAIVGNCTTAKEMTDKIESLFSDEEKTGITLSTVHKAKGLEADNVYICCPSLLPSKNAKLPWEIESEENLCYVAYSRPKKKLCFLNEDNMSKYSMTSQQKLNALQLIKVKIFYLYGDAIRCSGITPTFETAKVIIEHSTKIEELKENVKTVNNVVNNSSFSSFKNFGLSKKKKKC